jgi:hypothetical protein
MKIKKNNKNKERIIMKKKEIIKKEQILEKEKEIEQIKIRNKQYIDKLDTCQYKIIQLGSKKYKRYVLNYSLRNEKEKNDLIKYFSHVSNLIKYSCNTDYETDYEVHTFILEIPVKA